MPKKMPAIFFCGSLGLFALLVGLFGFYQHLYLGNFSSEAFIFGDDGDGYFNLWLLEKGKQKFIDGHWQALTNGGIFWPEHAGSYFWSDNLILYVPLYATFKSLLASPQMAFNMCTYVLVGFAYVVSLFFFSMLYLIASQHLERKPRLPLALIPLLAYANVFAEAKLRYLAHWQNLSHFWVLLLGTAALAISCSQLSIPKKKWCFWLLIVSQLSLMLSTLYFALTACLLLAFWTFVQWRLDRRCFLGLAQKSWLSLSVSLLISGIVAWVYMQNKQAPYSLYYLHGNRVQFWQFFIPREGILKTLTSQAGITLPEVNHEACAYWGLGLIAGLALWTAASAPAMIDALKRGLRSRRWLVFLALLLLCRLCLEFSPLLASYLAMALLIAALVTFLLSLGQAQRWTPVQRASLILGLFLLVCYGIAFGPARHFIAKSPVNASLWGLFSTLLPPIGNMRAIGRIAGLGHSFLMGLLFLTFLQAFNRQPSGRKKKLYLVAFSLWLLQFVDGAAVRPTITHPDESWIMPSRQESQWWQEQSGSVISFPTTPFHTNTSAMLYFANFPKIELLNGYSSHSTPIWDKVMATAEGSQEPKLEQLKLVHDLKADWIVLQKWRIPPEHLVSLKNLGLDASIAFENERFLVLTTEKLAQL